MKGLLLGALGLSAAVALWISYPGAARKPTYREVVIPPGRETAVPPPGIPWLGTWAEAAALSRISRRPVLVHFSGTPCGACRRMDRETLADPAVRDAIGRAFIPVYVNVGKDEETATRFDVAGIPSTQLRDADGALLAGQVGFLAPAAFLAWLAEGERKAATP